MEEMTDILLANCMERRRLEVQRRSAIDVQDFLEFAFLTDDEGSDSIPIPTRRRLTAPVVKATLRFVLETPDDRIARILEKR